MGAPLTPSPPPAHLDEPMSLCALQGRGHTSDGGASCHVPLGSLPSSVFAKCCLCRGHEGVPTVAPLSPSRQGQADGSLGTDSPRQAGVGDPRGLAMCPQLLQSPRLHQHGGRAAGTQGELAVAMTTKSHHCQQLVPVPPQKLPWHWGHGGCWWHWCSPSRSRGAGVAGASALWHQNLPNLVP